MFVNEEFKAVPPDFGVIGFPNAKTHYTVLIVKMIDHPVIDMFAKRLHNINRYSFSIYNTNNTYYVFNEILWYNGLIIPKADFTVFILPRLEGTFQFNCSLNPDYYVIINDAVYTNPSYPSNVLNLITTKLNPIVFS